MTTGKTINLISPGEGPTFAVVTDLVTFKVGGEESEGAFALVEVTVPPGGGPPALHTHPPQETFYILDGEFEIAGLENGQPSFRRATAGATVHIPGGVPHNYKNAGSTPGRFLALATPAGLEHFFAELGLPVTDKAHPPQPAGPPDIARIMEITRKYQIEFVGPPPGK